MYPFSSKAKKHKGDRLLWRGSYREYKNRDGDSDKSSTLENSDLSEPGSWLRGFYRVRALFPIFVSTPLRNDVTGLPPESPLGPHKSPGFRGPRTRWRPSPVWAHQAQLRPIRISKRELSVTPTLFGLVSENEKMALGTMLSGHPARINSNGS